MAPSEASETRGRVVFDGSRLGSDDRSERNATARRYRRPELTRFGSLSEMTQLDTDGMFDIAKASVSIG